MTDRHQSVGILAELAAVFAQHGQLRCAPTVEVLGDDIVITTRVRVEGEESLHCRSLLHEIEYLRDYCQLRALAAQFSIDPAQLEALLPKEKE